MLFQDSSKEQDIKFSISRLQGFVDSQGCVSSSDFENVSLTTITENHLLGLDIDVS